MLQNMICLFTILFPERQTEFLRLADNDSYLASPNALNSYCQVANRGLVMNFTEVAMYFNAKYY